MREHEPYLVGDNNVKRCRHCGSAWNDNMGISCIERPGKSNKLMPEPARRVYASEAWDALGARLAELRRERDAVNATPAPASVSVADEMDWLCG